MIIKIAGILLLVLLFATSGWAEEIDDLLPIIAKAESSNGKFLKGDEGQSLGKYQICKAVVIDYNRANGTNYKHSDLLKNEVSEKIARWHLKRIIKLLKRKGIYSKARVIFAWNAGLSTALKRPIPKNHKNKVYRKIYQRR